MKFKKLDNWFTRVLLIGLMALVYIGGYCEKPRPTNPNLRFLVGDTLNHTIHCSNPIVSPEGNTIYYLRANSDSARFDELTFGSIYSINADGTDNKEVSHGKYKALAISPDGKKLAAHSLTVTGSPPHLQPESLIVIFDLSTEKCDTYPAAGHWIWDIEFSKNNTIVYYSIEIQGYPSTMKIYSLNLLDSTNTLIVSLNRLVGFDVFTNDSLFIDSNTTFPQINPVYEKYVIGTSGFESLVLTLQNIDTHKLDTLPDSLIPYNGNVGYPYWFPNGKNIAFMAKPYNEPAGEIAGEIWILTDFFDQVDTTGLK